MKIGSNIYTQNFISFQKKQETQLQRAVEYCDKAEFDARKGDFDKAIEGYKKALAINPKYEGAQFKLAKAYKLKEDYSNAIQEFNKYLELVDYDAEALVMLGDCYRQQGFYKKANELFRQVVAKNPENDYAQRLLKESENQFYSIFNPVPALAQVKKVKNDTLTQAVSYAKDFLPPNFTDSMQNIQFEFNDTQKLSGYANIAQYENAKQKITVSNDYVWANPKLVGAYIVHEYIHAKDNDAYTSIREEQDAFRKQAEYWKQNGKGISDPEMDFILELYNTNPKYLDDRVREVYTLRDAKIAETSPYHPADNDKMSMLEKIGTGLIKYDAIA